MEDLILAIAPFQDNLRMGVEEQVWEHPDESRGQMRSSRFRSFVPKLEMGNRRPLFSLERVRHQFARHPKRPPVVDVRIAYELTYSQEIKGIAGESRVYHVAKRQ